MFGEFKLDFKSKEYKKYIKVYNQLMEKPLPELQTLSNLYTIKKQDLLRYKPLIARIPFFFTLCITIITIVCSISWNLSTIKFILLFLTVIAIHSLIEVARMHRINYEVHICELYIIICREIAEKYSYVKTSL